MGGDSGTLGQLAVVGHPIDHSRSPAMQAAALVDLGLEGEWRYGAIDLTPEDFEAGIRELAEAGYAGVNVTVPHKEAALRIADQASEVAEAIGASNTLTFSGERVLADNTDGPALASFLPEDLEGKQALVLGAGGAARAAIWALKGARASVSIWNRNPERAAGLAAETGVDAVEAPESDSFTVIVNASAAGMGGGDPFDDLPLAPDSFTSDQLIIDMVYGDGPDALIEAAGAADSSTVDGIDILVAQGALSLEGWTGAAPDRAVMEAAARGL